MSKKDSKGISKGVQVPEKTEPSNLQNSGKKKRYTGGNGKTGNNSLSVEKYNQIWTEFQRDQSIAAVARASRVSYHTARRYIQRGDPKRGLVALRDRFKEIQEETVAVERVTMATVVQNGLTLADKMQKYIEAQLGYELNRLAFDAEGNLVGQYVFGDNGKPECDGNGNPKIVPLTKLVNDPVQAFNTIERLRLRLLGEPDVLAAEDEYADYTEAEIRDLITTGKKPTRLAGRVITSKAATTG